MNMLRAYSDVLTGGAVVPPDANDTTIANIVISFAVSKIQMTHDRMETNTTMFEPFFNDMNILHQQHCFIDVPLILEAKDGLVTANNLLNIAWSRLSAIRDLMAPGLAWDLHDVLSRTLRVHVELQRAVTKNRDILHLFHRVVGANRSVFRNTFGPQLESNTWRW